MSYTTDVREEIIRLAVIEKESIKQIKSCKRAGEALNMAKTYEKLYQDTFLEYDEKCPEEESSEDTHYAMQLESYQKLLNIAKRKFEELEAAEGRESFSA